MGVNDPLAVALTDDEVRLLRHALGEWRGPARCTEQMAIAMGFDDVADLFEEGDRIRRALAEKQPLSQRDWVRALLATEIVFASDVLGSGLDWGATTGLSDSESVSILRSVQRKVPTAGSLEALLWTSPPR